VTGTGSLAYAIIQTLSVEERYPWRIGPLARLGQLVATRHGLQPPDHLRIAGTTRAATSPPGAPPLGTAGLGWPVQQAPDSCLCGRWR